jgi:hypothetical protein
MGRGGLLVNPVHPHSVADSVRVPKADFVPAHLQIKM